ncbi:phage tail protein [Listeria innocua]|nr:phage tail protein [Listeria innocua]EKP0370990.1 phage tail protein [Listeria innocua]
MILILNKKKEIVASISFDSPLGVQLFDDMHTEKITDFDSTYEFSVANIDDITASYLNESNFILLRDLDDDAIMFRIIGIEDIRDGKGIYKRITCENVFIYDLNNVIVPSRKYTAATITPVLTYILGGSGWVIESVESVGIADIEFSSYITAQEALHTVCAAFDCEVKFYVKTYQGRVVAYYCRVVKRLGENDGVRVESGTGIKGITRKKVLSDIKTALIPLGATQDNGMPLTISSVSNGLNYVADDVANKLYNENGNGYLMTVKTNEAITSPAALRDWGIAELKKINHHLYQYEVEVLMLEQVYGYESHKIRKGSYIRIIDHDMDTAVTVQARVIELNICYSSMEKSTCLVGDFIEINSKVPAVISKLQEVDASAENAKRVAYIANAKGSSASAEVANAVKKDDIKDSSWLNLTLNSSFRNGLPSNAALISRYRKTTVNNIVTIYIDVYVIGTLLKVQFSEVASLPLGFFPSSDVLGKATDEQGNAIVFEIKSASGKINARIADESTVETTTNLSLSVNYLV